MAVGQNLVPLVNIKIAGKWMFIPLKMVLIGIDPYPNGFMRVFPGQSENGGLWGLILSKWWVLRILDDGKVLIMECCGYISALKWERMTPNCGESYRKISFNYEMWVYQISFNTPPHGTSWTPRNMGQIIFTSWNCIIVCFMLVSNWMLEIGKGESVIGNTKVFGTFSMWKIEIDWDRHNELGSGTKFQLIGSQMLSTVDPCLNCSKRVYNHNQFLSKTPAICDWWNIYIYIYILCVCFLNIVTVSKKGSLLNTPQKRSTIKSSWLFFKDCWAWGHVQFFSLRII